VTLVEAPVLLRRQPHLVELVERDPKRADRALQHRREGEIERVAFGAKEPPGRARFFGALGREVHIHPAGETVLAVPLRLAVAQQHELVHGAQL
jgi:hypothetical protein